MKFRLICFLSAIIGLTACGGDDDSACSQADWLGTYEIQSPRECDLDSSTSVVFNELIVIEAGNSDAAISWDGDNVFFTECTATDFILELSLDGSIITSRLGECTAEYLRR